MFTVRPAVPDDAESIVDVRLAGWRAAFAHLLSPQFLAGLPRDEERWRDGLARARRSRTVVVEHDGQVVGYAFAGPSPEEDSPRPWMLYHLYQYPTMHGSGTGQALLDAAIEDRPTMLWTAEDNPRAIAFYRRNGFQPDGMRKLEPEWENLAEIRLVR